jgi:hypothetical protein
MYVASCSIIDSPNYLQQRGDRMKKEKRSFRDYSYKERAIANSKFTVILALFILFPEYPLWLYLLTMCVMGIGILYNIVMHVKTKRKKASK